VQVDPSALERVAGDVELLREDVAGSTKGIDTAAEELGRKLPGWRLARTSEDNAFAWQDENKRAAGWLEDYSTALERCARDYRHVDEVTAESLELYPEVD
jgi:hypothetical protein